MFRIEKSIDARLDSNLPPYERMAGPRLLDHLYFFMHQFYVNWPKLVVDKHLKLVVDKHLKLIVDKHLISSLAEVSDSKLVLCANSLDLNCYDINRGQWN